MKDRMPRVVPLTSREAQAIREVVARLEPGMGIVGVIAATEDDYDSAVEIAKRNAEFIREKKDKAFTWIVPWEDR